MKNTFLFPYTGRKLLTNLCRLGERGEGGKRKKKGYIHFFIYRIH